MVVKCSNITSSRDKTALNYASIMGLPIVGSVRTISVLLSNDSTVCYQNYNLISMAFYLGKYLPKNIITINTDCYSCKYRVSSLGVSDSVHRTKTATG